MIKKIRYKMGCYILCIFLSVTILQFMIAIICCRYAKPRLKQKDINKKKTKKKMKNNELKNHMFYFFDDIIKIEDFAFKNILLDEKWNENNLIYDVFYKTLITLICAKPLLIMFENVDRFIKHYNRTEYLMLFGSGKYNKFQ